jgi:dienelactone hydrolase
MPPDYRFGLEVPAYRANLVNGTAWENYYQTVPYLGGDTEVFGYFDEPDTIPDGTRIPGVVLLHGGGDTAIAWWATQWADRGYAAIAPDLGGLGPDRASMVNGSIPQNTNPYKYKNISLGYEFTWPYHALAHTMKAISLLASRPEVDPSRIAVVGASFGGYLTCLVAGLDERVAAAVPVYGCAFMDESYVWTSLSLTDADHAQWNAYFEPATFMANATAPMLFKAGTNDTAFPTPNYMKSAGAVPSPVTYSMYVGRYHCTNCAIQMLEPLAFVDGVFGLGPKLPSIIGMTESGGMLSATATGAVSDPILHYTLDAGAWEARTWQASPLSIVGNTITGVLPAGTTGYFINTTVAGSSGRNVTSSGGLNVTSEVIAVLP